MHEPSHNKNDARREMFIVFLKPLPSGCHFLRIIFTILKTSLSSRDFAQKTFTTRYVDIFYDVYKISLTFKCFSFFRTAIKYD